MSLHLIYALGEKIKTGRKLRTSTRRRCGRPPKVGPMPWEIAGVPRRTYYHRRSKTYDRKPDFL